MRRFNETICIFVLVLALAGIGLVMVYSSSAAVAASYVNRTRSRELRLGEIYRPVNYHWLFLQKQLVWCVLGLGGLLLFYAVDYNEILRRGKWLVLAAAVLCLCVYIPGLGVRINGALRWLKMGPFQFQPSELAKLALIVGTAKMLNDRRDQLHSFGRGFFLPLAIASGFVGFIGIEDLGSAVVLGLITATLWFVAGVRFRHLAALGPIGMAALAVGVLMKEYRRERVWTFLTMLINGGGVNPVDMGEKSWHIKQALIAVGTGGWTGLGPGLGIQKHYFLPAVFTDFVFADICEELGFLGALAVLGLFAALIVIGFRVAYRSPDFVGALVATGLISMIAVPVLINVGVVLACLPTKGLALPFISYGGSSLMMNLCGMGLLMNIARRNEELQEVRRPPVVTTWREPGKLGRIQNAY